MNRKKKINQVLKAKVKKMNAKMQKSNKPKYVSKAERAAIAAKKAENSTVTDDTITTAVVSATDSSAD